MEKPSKATSFSQNGRVANLARFIRSNQRQRMLVLYGSGTLDRFFLAENEETDIYRVLWLILHSMGYLNIAYFSPHRSLHFLDEHSKNGALPPQKTNSAPDNPDEQEPPQQDSQTAPRVMHLLENGPFQNRMMLPETKGTTPAGSSPQVQMVVNEKPNRKNNQEEIFDLNQTRIYTLGQGAMGDVHAIRTLHSMMMSEEQNPTAVIIQQAEISLSYFDDKRTLSGLISEWQHLPTSNRNICILVFSASDKQILQESSRLFQFPEITNSIGKNDSTNSLHEIGAPQEEEIRWLITSNPTGTHFKEKPDQLRQLSNWMAAEKKAIRTWADRIVNLDTFTLDAARKASWFKSIRDPQESAKDKLDKLIGLEDVKHHIHAMHAWLVVTQKRQQGNHSQRPSLHMVFSGSPGTGKTTVARLVGELYHEIALLPTGHLVEVKASDLIANHVGGTPQQTEQRIQEALGGVLFLDEAYMLTEEGRGDFGKEALDTLLTRMEDQKPPWVLITAGYPDKMSKFLNSNPGLSRRIPEMNRLLFRDYSPEDLFQILEKMLDQRQLPYQDDFQSILKKIINGMYAVRDENFGNAGEMRNLAEGIERLHALRVFQNKLPVDTPVCRKDLPRNYHNYLKPKANNLDEIFDEVNNLVGLENVKKELHNIANRIQLEIALKKIEERNHPDQPTSTKNLLRHFLFSGNPGTGKTTTARLLGRIFRQLGLLRKGHCIEVARGDLVGAYVGHTAIKTEEKFLKALDGILFIDEAYSLAARGSNDFGQEAIDTLVKLMEDHRDRVVVIAAGYPDKMETFLRTNPGLSSRFQKKIPFPDFTKSEMGIILNNLANEDHLTLPDEVEEAFLNCLMRIRQKDQMAFGNARAVIQTYETMKDNLATRFAIEREQKTDITTAELVQPGFTLEDVPSIQ